MTIRRDILIIIILVSLLAGCGPPESQVIAPGFDMEPTAEPTMLLETEAGDGVETAILPVYEEAELPPGLAGVREIWSYAPRAGQTAMATASQRLSILLADGRILWLNTLNGTPENSAYLWPGMLGGQTEGELQMEGMMTVALAYERLIPGEEDRARLAAYDTGGREIWSMPIIDRGARYTMVSTTDVLFVGRWPVGSYDNFLTAYNIVTGEEIWEFEEELAGYRSLAVTDDLLLVLMETWEGSVVFAVDAESGEEVWRWEAGEEEAPERIAAGDGRVYLIVPDGIIALNLITGTVNWRIGFDTDTTAPIVVSGGEIFTIPARIDTLDYRPGAVSLSAASGELVWHVFQGSVVDSLTITPDALWLVRKDYDSGVVRLEALDPTSGLTLASLVISNNPDPDYRVLAAGNHVYVTGDHVHGFYFQREE